MSDIFEMEARMEEFESEVASTAASATEVEGRNETTAFGQVPAGNAGGGGQGDSRIRRPVLSSLWNKGDMMCTPCGVGDGDDAGDEGEDRDYAEDEDDNRSFWATSQLRRHHRFRFQFAYR